MHTTSIGRGCFKVLIAGTLTLPMIPLATIHADPPRYRVTWIVPNASSPTALGFDPNPHVHGTMGINNKGQVVYGWTVSNVVHAGIWLPESDGDYLMSAGWHDLSRTGLDTPHIARDVNEDGFVAGQSNGIEQEEASSRGTAWALLASSSLDFVNFSPLQSGTGSWCGLHGINNDSPPVAVGASFKTRFCCYNEVTPQARISGFRVLVNGTASPVELEPGGSRNYNIAFDVNTIPSENARISGLAMCELDGSACANFCDVWGGSPCDPCLGLGKAATWLGHQTGVETLMTQLNSSGKCEGRGINNASEIAGWGFDVNNQTCVPHTLYWSSPTANPTDLGFTNGDGSEGFAINNLSLPKIVGWNTDTLRAFLWEKTSTSWTATNLNDTSMIGGATSIWTIRRGDDINDDNWIPAIALKNGVSGFCAVVLTPIPSCPEDVNRDGCVDFDDYDEIINHASYGGECPPNVICHWDVNGDYLIDSNDAYALTECMAQEPVCCGCESLMGQSQEDMLAELITRVLASNLSDEQESALIVDLLSVFGQ